MLLQVQKSLTVTAFCIRYGHGLGLEQFNAVLNNQQVHINPNKHEVRLQCTLLTDLLTYLRHTAEFFLRS